MEHRQINENYRAIAEKLIAQEPALAFGSGSFFSR